MKTDFVDLSASTQWKQWLQWMILTVCAADAGNTYQGKLTETTDTTMHNPTVNSHSLDRYKIVFYNVIETVENQNRLRLFVKVDQYFDHFFKICSFKNLFLAKIAKSFNNG